MKQPKYPCRNCKYFNACGDNMRTMPCEGRETEKKESEIMRKLLSLIITILILMFCSLQKRELIKMLKQYIVCLCFGRDHCKEVTSEIAKKNNAIDWFIEPVYAPLTEQLAYRGTIVKGDTL